MQKGRLFSRRTFVWGVNNCGICKAGENILELNRGCRLQKNQGTILALVLNLFIHIFTYYAAVP